MGDLQSLLSELANYGDVSLISVATERYGYGAEGDPNPYLAAHKCLERLANGD